MGPSLQLLTAIALGFAAFAFVLWLWLLIHRILENRNERRRKIIEDEWLERLLPVLENSQTAETLRPPSKGEEMEVVLGLLRELAERFRGEYLEAIRSVIGVIGAEAYGLDLLSRRGNDSRLEGCSLLGWAGSGSEANSRLAAALENGSPEIRLEAAHALALRRAPEAEPGRILSALRGSAALQSERARDIIRLMAPERGEIFARLLSVAKEPREQVLLLEGIAASGDLRQSPHVVSSLTATFAQVRAAAVLTLERLADPFHIHEVTLLAKDTDRGVRNAVARYAATMAGDPAAMSVLKDLTDDPDFEIRRVAVYALAKSGGLGWDSLCGKATVDEDRVLGELIVEASQSVSAFNRLPASSTPLLQSE